MGDAYWTNINKVSVQTVAVAWEKVGVNTIVDCWNKPEIIDDGEKFNFSDFMEDSPLEEIVDTYVLCQN